MLTHSSFTLRSGRVLYIVRAFRLRYSAAKVGQRAVLFRRSFCLFLLILDWRFFGCGLGWISFNAIFFGLLALFFLRGRVTVVFNLGLRDDLFGLLLLIDNGGISGLVVGGLGCRLKLSGDGQTASQDHLEPRFIFLHSVFPLVDPARILGKCGPSFSSGLSFLVVREGFSIVSNVLLSRLRERIVSRDFLSLGGRK